MKHLAIFIATLLFFLPASASEENSQLNSALTTQVLIVEAQIFNRQFSEAFYSCASLFFEDRTFPLDLICRAIVLESVMFDREDFHRQEELVNLSATIKSKLVGRKDQTMVWQSLFTGAFWGIVGLNDLRRHSFYTAFKNGYKGLTETKRVSQRDPENRDVYLGLGIYDYYAAVLSKQLWWFPFALGNRDRGIAELTRAAYSSVLAKDPAQLMLAFFYFREKKYDQATSMAQVLIKKYPGCSMTAILMARIFIAQGKTPEAMDQLQTVQRMNPANRMAPLLLEKLMLGQ